ncbi:thiolase, N-terminal domain protein [Mycobacterium ulcerans str. Harvey]|uniref:Thiolase, N-terminal domain protein n=1 Tax=Mycobacterium ulcerans str. Harvey TaxID=1299332 RepID=A0ABP3AL61_MYCUL|nr:thiolase, N-terminal domain protein [Mycobacterium ulcerans str. Harvey]
MQAGEQALDIARTSLLTAGWPETVPGVTVDRQCGSSQQSVHFAAAGVVAGHYDVVVAGGVESMSRTPMGSSLGNGGRPYSQTFLERYDGRIPNQGLGAEMIAEQWGLSRTMLDEFSLMSHEKAAAAQDSGHSMIRSSASRTRMATPYSRMKVSGAERRWKRWRR